MNGSSRDSNPILPAWKSALIPGWGQASSGRRTPALVFGLVALALSTGVAGFALWAASNPISMAGRILNDDFLLGLIAINVAILAFRMAAALDAFTGSGGRVMTLSLLLVMGFVLVPHVAAGWTQVRSYQALTRATSGESLYVSDVPPSGSAAPGTTPTAPSTTTTTVAWEGRDRLTVLLLGSDASPGRMGVRTDAMIVATIDLQDADLALFGLPRNLSSLAFPDGTEYVNGDGILNEVYAYGLAHPELFSGADPGATAIKEMIGGILGIDIHYYVVVDLEGFVDLVDALGSVTVTVTDTVRVPVDPFLGQGAEVTDRQRVIFPGTYDMTGSEALSYLRSRVLDDDYDRMGRQRCFLADLVSQVDFVALVANILSLLSTIESNVRTDMPLETIPRILELAGSIDVAEALAVGLTPPDWNDGFAPGGYPRPALTKIRNAVQVILADPETARELYGLDAATVECGLEDPTPAETSTTATTSSG